MKRWMRLFLFGLLVGSGFTSVHPATARGAYVQETPAEDQRTVWTASIPRGRPSAGRSCT